MAFDLEPRDPLEPTEELVDAPLAEVITNLAESVAEGQARLDLSAAEVVEELASRRVSIIPSIRQVVREDGGVEFEQGSAVEVSLLELGLTPTFYAFSEATAEVAMDLKVVQSATESGSSEQRAFLSVGTRSLRTERRLNREVSVHSRMSTKLVPVPAPVRLEPTLTVVDQPEGVGSLAFGAPTVTGGTTTEGTVTLNASAPAGGVSVALSSANPDVAEVPSNVNVPAGSATAQFQVSTEPVSSPTPVAITASSQDVQQTATLTVQPPALARLALDSATLLGRETSQGTVTLDASAPAGGVSVALSSADPEVAEVPLSVNVPAGSATAQFPVNTKSVSNPTSVTITALSQNVRQTATLTVQPLAPARLELNPATVLGGNTSQGTVTLTGTAPAGGLSVALSSANPAIVRVPSSVNVPAGSTTVQFQVNTEPVSNSTPVAITAASQGVQRAATLTVQPPAVTQLTLDPATVTGGERPQGTVRLDGPAPANFAVTLRSANPSVATVQASVTVPVNATSATFPVTTQPVSSASQVEIVASRARVDRSATLAVQPSVPTNFTFSPQSIALNGTSTATITLSGPAPGGTSVALSGSNTTTANFPASVPVPPNATQITFTATGQSFTGANRSVTVTASYLGETRSATLTVVAAIGPGSVTVNPTTVVGRTATVQGTVTLTGTAPSGGLSVALSSANSTIVRVPSSVNVSAGSTTAQFQVSTEPVSSSTPVAITASSQGVQQTTTLTVQPPTPSTLTLSPQQIRGGETSTGTIELNGPAPGGTSVALRGSNTTTANFPSSVPVPLNATRVAFTATGQSFTGANRSVTITASYLGGTRSATLTVLGEVKDKELAAVKEKDSETSLVPGTEESGEPGGEEEGPASGRAFVQPEERESTEEDQPPAEEEKPRARRRRRKPRREG